MLFCFQNQNTRVGFMHLKLLFKAILENKIIGYIAETNPMLNHLTRLYISCYSLYIYHIYIRIGLYGMYKSIGLPSCFPKHNGF